MLANLNKRAVVSDALLRRLHLVSQGKRAQLSSPHTIATATLDGMLLQRGLVRIVKHRDHTRTYTLTDAGAAILNARAKEQR